MGSLGRLFLFVFLVSIILLVRLPAGMMDRILAQSSNGTLRLTNSEGTFWRGSGILAAADNRGRLIALRTIEWRLAFFPARGTVALHLTEGGLKQAKILLSANALRIDGLRFHIPLELITASASHPAARVGWHGTLDLRTSGFSCTWKGECEGVASIRWNDAGLDILPDRHLGNHEAVIEALGREMNITVTTLDGEFHFDGQGTFRREGGSSFRARVTGDPEIVDRIPDIMDQNARRTGLSGEVLLSFP